jgi:hypothetical protein
MKPFACEVLFQEGANVTAAAAALAAASCKYETDPDARDPYSDAVFGMVTGTTERDLDALSSWLSDILRPHSGEVLEWGYGEPWRPSER